MKNNLVQLVYEIELEPGEQLSLPPGLVEKVGAGRWLITVSPVSPAVSAVQFRDHSAFLNSYAPEDEGLYDDCRAG